MKTHLTILLLLMLVFAGSFEGWAQGDSLKNILFETSPPGATHIIDGVMYGETPQYSTLSHGYHRITIFHKEYLKLFDEIFIHDNTHKFTFNLTPLSPGVQYNSKNISLTEPDTETANPNIYPPNIYSRELYSLEEKYSSRFSASVLVAATTAIATIASHGVANEKYKKWKNQAPENRDELKRQVQILDAISITSLTICLASTYAAIYYSKQLSKSRRSGSLSATILPMHSGAGISLNYTLP